MSRATIESAASTWIARRDHGLTADEQVEFDRWLADPHHARAYARHEKAWQIVDQPMNAGQGKAFADESRRRAAKRRRRSLAASSMVALLVFAFFLRPVTAPDSSDAIPRSAVVVRPYTLKLADGSVVDFKAGTQVVSNFTADGTEPRRVRLLKGEAHFVVTKNKARPFIVEVGDVEFRAVGTAFTIERTESKAELVVSEGTVAVDQRALEAATMPPTTLVTLTAGQRTFVELAAPTVPHVEPLAPAAFADRLAWRETRLEFTGTPLSEAVRLLNQYNTVKFVIDDSSLGALEVSGFFGADKPDLFVLLLDKGFGVRADRQGDVIHLRKAL